MAFPDRRTVNIMLTILLIAAGTTLLYAARRVLLLFVLAILLAYLINPVVRFLQHHSLLVKDLRKPAILETYFILLLLIVFAGRELGPGLVGPSGLPFTKLPGWIQGLSTGEIATEIGEKYGWSEDAELRLKAFLVHHREGIERLVQNAEQVTSNALIVMVIVPILALFFLADGRQIADAIIRIASTESNHQEIRAVADELDDMFRRYIRAKVILSACSFAFYAAALLLLRFPHAIGIAALGGVLEFIPVAGWMTTAATIVGVGVFTQSHWIWMAVFLGIWRIMMDYFISPRVVGENLEIHPLLVLFAVMAGGQIGGIVGVYLSIPLVVVIRVLWHHRTAPATRASAEWMPADKSP
jgi:predicted PurR-regulated permease PerM